MDMNVYLVEWWAKERLGEIRAAVGREQLAEALRQRPGAARDARAGADQVRAERCRATEPVSRLRSPELAAS